MKTNICLLLLLPILAYGKVGPDLSAGNNVDYYTKLRMDYANNPKTEFFPMWRTAPEHEALVEAYKKGNVDEVIRIGDSWLNKCPIDADSHLRIAICFKEKGISPVTTII
ncbi:MAG: hypothetical protein HC904_07875 [Blastochloris sp.]|nr:hypothetical protein [Blastochloris sp.]